MKKKKKKEVKNDIIRRANQSCGRYAYIFLLYFSFSMSIYDRDDDDFLIGQDRKKKKKTDRKRRKGAVMC